MRAGAYQGADELARGHRVSLPVSGEPTAAIDAIGRLADVRQAIVRKAHCAAPAMRDRCIDPVLAEERVELTLDPVTRAVILADFLVDRGAPPPPDAPVPPSHLTPLPPP